MTNEEALSLFKNHEYMTDFSWQDEMSEIAISAIEKQIPKKLKKVYDRQYYFWVCPCCEGWISRELKVGNCCANCGQKLDFEEGEN